MPRRRRSVFASRPSYGRSAMWLEPGSMRRRRGPRRFLAPLMAVLALAAAIAAVVYVVLGTRNNDPRPAAAQKFAAAWAKGDRVAMRNLLDDDTKKAYSQKRFNATYRAAERAATVTGVRTGKVQKTRGGRFVVPVAVRTRVFGTLRGVVVLPMVQAGGEGRVRWRPFLRLPGLRPGESVTRRVLSRPHRAAILAADGRRLDRLSGTAGIVGTAPGGDSPGSGLERRYDQRLGGRPGAELRYGHRLIRRVKVRRGQAVHATISPGLQRAAQQALGNRLGGVALLRPRDGSVLALAGLAVSGPQPPGSTFKIITLSAALQNGIAKPTSTYPVRTAATLSGVLLRNASNESCGGTLVNAFVVSCNSVFAPLGAKLGAKRLVAAAERFGFNETPAHPRREGRADLAAERAARQPRRRRGRDRPGPRPRDPADDGERRSDDRREGRAGEAAHHAQRRGHPPPRGPCEGRGAGALDDDRRRPGRDRHGGADPGRPGRGQDRHGGAAARRPAGRPTPRTPTRGSSPSRRRRSRATPSA